METPPQELDRTHWENLEAQIATDAVRAVLPLQVLAATSSLVVALTHGAALWRRGIPPVAALVLVALSFVELRKGRPRRAAAFAAFATCTAIVLGATLNGALKAPVMTLSLFLVALSSWAFGYAGGTRMAVFVTAFATLIAGLDALRALPQPEPPPVYFHLLITVLGIWLTWSATALPNRGLRQAMSDAWHAESERLRRTHEERLRRIKEELLTEMLRDQTREREHVAMALNEGVAQDVAAILLTLDRARHAPTLEEARTVLGELDPMRAGIIDRIRAVGEELRPSVLAVLGLGPALEAMLRRRRAGTSCTLTFDDQLAPDEPISDSIAVALFRVAEEAIDNALRHAAANGIHVTIEDTQGTICLRVYDDGRGFDLSSVEAGDPRAALGIAEMRHRIEACAGSFWIETSPGRGTKVLARIPRAATPAP